MDDGSNKPCTQHQADQQAILDHLKYHQHPYFLAGTNIHRRIIYLSSVQLFSGKTQPPGGAREHKTRTAFLICLLGDHLTSYTAESFDITLLWQKMIAL